VFNVVYLQVLAVYDSGCQICCNGFNVPAHQRTMPQINMIRNPVTLNRHWANSPALGLKWWMLTREAAGANFSVFDSNPGLPHTERTLYPQNDTMQNCYFDLMILIIIYIACTRYYKSRRHVDSLLRWN